VPPAVIARWHNTFTVEGGVAAGRSPGADVNVRRVTAVAPVPRDTHLAKRHTMELVRQMSLGVTKAGFRVTLEPRHVMAAAVRVTSRRAA
jgi:hypothetical protein